MHSIRESSLARTVSASNWKSSDSSLKPDGAAFFFLLWLDFAWHYLLRGACALAAWLGFFSRLRLGVALAAGRFQRDFAVRKEGKGGAPAFDFRHWREFSRDEAHLALLVWFVFCI